MTGLAPCCADEEVELVKFEGEPIRSLLRDRRIPFIARLGGRGGERVEEEEEGEEEGETGSGRGLKTA